jgi:RNA-directed DNA polymerase
VSVKPIQIGLPFKIEGDAFASNAASESPVGKERLMELILLSENLKRALQRVKQNKGAAGVDDMGTDQLHDHLKRHWASIKSQLLKGTYQPQPVKRVEIPKPGGGKRMLGIPTVLDRFIQQAMLQILQELWDETFSQFSYGFRPSRSAHQAIKQAQHYVQDGYRWVVDMDLEKFLETSSYCTPFMVGC